MTPGLAPATVPNASKTYFFEITDPKIGGGIPNPNPTPPGGATGGGGNILLCHIYIYIYIFSNLHPSPKL